MSEKIDVLAQAWNDAAKFSVNSGVPEVPVTIPALPAGKLLRADGLSIFTWKDNFILLSAGIAMPLGFELIFHDLAGTAHVLPSITLFYQRISDNSVRAFDSPAFLYTIFESYELNLGNFVEPPDAVNESYRLLFQLNANVKVSMLNVDPSLNEMEFTIPIFAKVLHTLPLS